MALSIDFIYRQAFDKAGIPTPPEPAAEPAEYKPQPRAADEFAAIEARRRELEVQCLQRVSGDWPDGGG